MLLLLLPVLLFLSCLTCANANLWPNPQLNHPMVLQAAERRISGTAHGTNVFAIRRSLYLVRDPICEVIPLGVLLHVGQARRHRGTLAEAAPEALGSRGSRLCRCYFMDWRSFWNGLIFRLCQLFRKRRTSSARYRSTELGFPLAALFPEAVGSVE
uniref:(northern house mosquito) hypothetical protein n=1 Tax=Culex pipiens TaxID=7175 RepID=A0A8D8CEL7_CULPI